MLVWRTSRRCTEQGWVSRIQSVRPLRVLGASCSARNISASPVLSSTSEFNFDAARKWYARVGNKPLPHEIGEVSYARSSGPGGQNVNKVNSKAQLRVPLSQLFPLLPEALHEAIKSSPFYAGKTDSLLIQSDDSRKQQANREHCFRKLDQLIVDTYTKVVPGETSAEQKQKVKKLQVAENESRLQMKKKISSKKSARRGNRDD